MDPPTMQSFWFHFPCKCSSPPPRATITRYQEYGWRSALWGGGVPCGATCGTVLPCAAVCAAPRSVVRHHFGVAR
eukprot:gene11207-biopygen5909